MIGVHGSARSDFADPAVCAQRVYFLIFWKFPTGPANKLLQSFHIRSRCCLWLNGKPPLHFRYQRHGGRAMFGANNQPMILQNENVRPVVEFLLDTARQRKAGMDIRNPAPAKTLQSFSNGMSAIALDGPRDRADRMQVNH